MFFSKSIKIITVFIFIYTFQVGADLYANQVNDSSSDISKLSPSDATELSENKGILSGYSFSLGTSILSKYIDEETDLLIGTVNMLVTNKDWSYQDLYINFQVRNPTRDFLIETIPRIFFSFPILSAIKFYAGVGLGLGFQPEYIFGDKKGKIFVVNFQTFSGLKVPDIYRNFGCFLEFNWTIGIFPFYTYEDSKNLADDFMFNSFSLNFGISYLF